MKSALYMGRVRHRRREPRHQFFMPLFLVYLDLAELDQVLRMTRWWGRGRFRLARFRREDYLTHGGLGLEEAVRTRVAAETGVRPAGPVRMMTNLRYFGHCFNPVTFYFCFSEREELESIVAEITNTPWGERYSYVLSVRDARRSGHVLRWRFGKEFHVSPFLPMELEYDWSFTRPAEKILVHMNLRDRSGKKSFDATLTMNRRELTPSRMRSVLIRFPFMTVRVIARIHFEALRLWLKRATVFPHPHPAREEAGT